MQRLMDGWRVESKEDRKERRSDDMQGYRAGNIPHSSANYVCTVFPLDAKVFLQSMH